MKSKTFRTVLFVLFIIYSLYLFYLLFLQRLGYYCIYFYNRYGLFSREHFYSCNLIPFKTIGEYIALISKGRLVRISIINIFGNLVAFAPMGVFVPLLFRSRTARSFWRFTLLFFLVICAVEVLQFLTFTGSLDVDDLILNLSGACIAFGITTAFIRRKENV